MASREPLTLTELQLAADAARRDLWDSIAGEPMPPPQWMSALPGEVRPERWPLEVLLNVHIGPLQQYTGYDRTEIRRKLGELLVYVAQWASYHDVSLDEAAWAALARLGAYEPGEAVHYGS